MTHYKKILGAALLVLIFAAAGAAQTAPPVLTPIGAQSVDEGQILSFTITATDADLTTPVMRATSPLPAANMTFTDNLDGSGSFSFNPDFTQSGIINITFYADDAVTADIDSEQVVITVTDAGVSAVTLSSTSGNDYSSDDLTASYTVTGAATTTTAWTVDGLPLAVAQLPIEGGATNAPLDYSGSGNNGILGAGATWSPTAGHDGNGGILLASEAAAIDLGDIMPQGSYTKSAWIRRIGAAAGNNIISGNASHVFWAPSANGFILAAGHNGSWFLVEDATAVPIAVDTWYHVAVTYDLATTTMVLYKDGIEVDRNTAAPAIGTADLRAWVSRFSTGFGMPGAVDDVRLYDRALSGEQIANLASGSNDVIDANETSLGDSWQAQVTGFSPLFASETVASNSLTIVNEPAVWEAQADTTIDEGQSLSLVVTATDPDGLPLTLDATATSDRSHLY